NLGDIFMDALTFACKGDIDKALSLNPEDYESVEYEYDLNANTIGAAGKPGKTGKILFIRLKN
ncbi:MAG: hypothetical protein OEM19_05275, partial [Deltaproteobacteria bacterium]|nr:hypothetical protein [Deltaproteobacteria bacterium]